MTSSTTTTPCPSDAYSDGSGGCYWFDTCEMLYEPCDCENGRTICCTFDQCITITTTIITITTTKVRSVNVDNMDNVDN